MGKIIQIDTIHHNNRNACTANGTGIRVIIWFSGCNIKCPGCQNLKYQNSALGEKYSKEHLDFIFTELDNYDFYDGISILGGEPFTEYNKNSVLDLVQKFREKYGKTKTIWIWSGFLYENLLKDDISKQILKSCDYLVDGPFIQEKRNISLKFRGSDNQRIICLNK